MIIGNMFRNKVQTRNYALVQLARELEEHGVCVYEEGGTIVGCVYEEDGRYTKHYLVPELDNIARFICSSDKDKLLLNGSDYAIASTMGIFLDVSVDSFTDKVLPHLRKRQREKESIRFEELV